MGYCYSLGLDMAKLSFDYALLDQQGEMLLQGQVINDESSILEWIKELSSVLADEWAKTLVCLEHSGYYNARLLQFMYEEVEANIWLESPLQIKRSGGLQRGKDDALDAQRIAAYGLDFQRRAILWQPRGEDLDRLSLLISHRDRMVKHLMSLENALGEQSAFISPVHQEELVELNKEPMAALRASIAELERKIKELLEHDKSLARQRQIIMSIPGFGPVIASKLIMITEGFTRLTTARKLACFAGVAPFPNRSGTSLRGRTKVSPFANKEIKKMLHLAALVTIRKNNIMYDYYQRKVAAGKHKMSVINAVRNKLLHILMACIRNDTIYQKNYQ